MTSHSRIYHQRHPPVQSAGDGSRGRRRCCCCCCFKRTKTVAPFPEFDPNYDYIEIRPNRFLRVRHVNLKVPKETTEGGTPVRSTPTPLHPNNLHHPNALNASAQDVKSDVITHSVVLNDTPSDGSTSGNHATASTSMPQDNSNHTTGQANNLMIQERTRTASSVDIKLHHQKSRCVVKASPEHVPSQNASVPVPRPSEGIPSSGIQTTRDSAPSDDSVIFLVHGVGGSSDVWQAQIEFLGAIGYQLVIPDLIGHGFSSTPNNESAYEFNEIMQDMYAVFDKYSKEKNVIIGHSYG